MENLAVICSHAVILPVDHISTGQIIPERFVKPDQKFGLGAHLFADWRRRPDGSPDPRFVLNQLDVAGAQILSTGEEFGHGASAEHAVWALLDYGFRAIVAPSFAETFVNAAIRHGLAPVQIDRYAHQAMLAVIRERPQAEFAVDLRDQVLVWPEGHEVYFPIDPAKRQFLLDGLDEAAFLFGSKKRAEVYSGR